MKVINRIKANEEFVSTVRKGRALRTSSYIVHYQKNELNICRIGLSVSKKIGNAVVRNRVKRQIRAMCDSLIDYSLHACDIVIVAKPEFIGNDYATNYEILKKAFTQIGIFNEK